MTETSNRAKGDGKDYHMSSSNMIGNAMTEALGRFLDVDVNRYKLIAVNLANIDTPGYHTRDLDFHAELQRLASEDSEPAGLQLASSSASSNPIAHQVRGLM